MSFDFIWFDLGYTLLYVDREELFAEVLADSDKRSLEEIGRAFHVTDKRLMREFPGLLGRPSVEFMPLYLDLLCEYLDIHGDIASLFSRWTEIWDRAGIWQAYPEAASVLRRLSAEGLRLGVISNWDPGARPLLSSLGLIDYFETVIISSEVGCSKPDERIFRIALDKAGVDASRCLYVGDNYYDDGIGASSVGMRYCIVNRYGTFGVEELAGQPLISGVAELVPYLEQLGMEGV